MWKSLGIGQAYRQNASRTIPSNSGGGFWLAGAEGCFTRWSDVDIAAWGIPPEDTFRAVGVVMDTSDEFVINLVDMNIARPSLLGVIEQEGVEI
jgi:hypothetical protein